MAESTAPRELHPLEVKVLLQYKQADVISQARLAADLGYNTGQVNQALSWLSAKGFVEETARASTEAAGASEQGLKAAQEIAQAIEDIASQADELQNG